MLKYIYRVIILIGVFIASIFYFSRDIKEVVFDVDNTTIMENATFPLVTIKNSGMAMNLMHGYSNNLNANTIREAVTPLGPDQSLEIVIDQKENEIKKLIFELREFSDNTLLEEDTVSVFEEDENIKTASIKIKTQLTQEKEYALKVTLVTSESKKLYFYQRIKPFENAYVKEKLDFILDFHKALLKKSTAQNVLQYLEPDSDVDNTSLAHVNINSSFDLVSWGNLKPSVITEVIPTIRECYIDTASVELNYIVKSDASGSTEYYSVREFYRIKYTTSRMYLLNYERNMESLFDANLISLTKSEIKLGITSDFKVPYLSSDDEKMITFVRGRKLWLYDLEENKMTLVFSYAQEKTDYIRDIYDQHEIRIIDMDAEGNINFCVYGYINRGQYEGRVAVVLYEYIKAENRVEELLYIPVEEPYQTLKEHIGDFSYMSSMDIFYFHIFERLYSYNLITRELKELANHIPKENLIEIKDINTIVWQEDQEGKEKKDILVMNLETGERQTITAPSGYNIMLLDKIDSNIIYGFVKPKDIVTSPDGRQIIPFSEIEIVTYDKKILKNYKKSGYYITAIKVNDNVVELTRVKKSTLDGIVTYHPATSDYIMNQIITNKSLLKVTTRVTDLTLTEVYLSMPSGFVMKEIPTYDSAVNTIITQDPTVRLPETEMNTELYYAYVYGGVSKAFRNAGDAVKEADQKIGTVINENKQIVWERVAKGTKKEIDITKLNWAITNNRSIETCLKLLLSYQGVAINLEQLSMKNNSMYDMLKTYGKKTPVLLDGITLDQALYYVSEGRPVIAMTGDREAVLIYGYDGFNIMVIDPQKGTALKIGLQDGNQLFQEAGNIYLSYLE
ncbi:MAG: putative rane protein [Herbinix sp.]|jgi:hypothetical protein|nr:putative rane protein [Herbinix sp.]